MRKNEPKSTLQGAKNGRDLLHELKRLLQERAESGDAGTVRGLVEEVRKELDASALEALVRMAKEREEELSKSIGRRIRERSEQEDCECHVGPPNYRIGCVRLRQKNNQWQLSVLDNECIERFETLDGYEVFDRAMRHIRSIEAALQRVPDYLKRCEQLMRALQQCGVERIPLNLFMVALGSSRNPLTALARGQERENADGLSRGQFSFVLPAVRHQWQQKQIHWELDFSDAV